MEGHVMKRTPYLDFVYDLILATATAAGLTVTAALVFGGAKLAATAAPTDVAFARVGMAVATDSTTARSSTPEALSSARRPHEQDLAHPGAVPARADRQRDRTVTAATGVPESRALGLFALGLLVTAGRLSVVERRRASTPLRALPMDEGETAASAR